MTPKGTPHPSGRPVRPERKPVPRPIMNYPAELDCIYATTRLRPRRHASVDAVGHQYSPDLLDEGAPSFGFVDFDTKT